MEGVKKGRILVLVKVGIRKLGQRKVFGAEGFGECRTYDIGFLGRNQSIYFSYNYCF